MALICHPERKCEVHHWYPPLYPLWLRGCPHSSPLRMLVLLRRKALNRPSEETLKAVGSREEPSISARSRRCIIWRREADTAGGAGPSELPARRWASSCTRRDEMFAPPPFPDRTGSFSSWDFSAFELWDCSALFFCGEPFARL